MKASLLVQGVRQVVEALEASVVYPPTYSPDFNPIDLWWADLKRQLRGLGPHVLGDLAQTVRRLQTATPLPTLTAWFRRCLYFPQLNLVSR
ncbi:transposase [Melittangium boletus]|uniref:transposase n=1 Tax=Melittangium boletus TaxID=83453 RepID=UPI0012FDE933